MIGILKKIDEKSELYLTIYMVLNVIWIFFGMFLNNYVRFSYSCFSTSFIIIFIINFLIIIMYKFLKKVKFNKIDIFIILLVFFGLISTIFSKNIGVSLYGCWKRYEGFFQLLYYYSLLYLSTLIFNDKLKKIIITFVLIFGLINVFVAFLQVFDVLKFIPINNRGVYLAQGLIGNSNFFGSYMVLCLGICIGMFLYNKEKRLNNIVLLLFCLLFYSGLLLSNALSGMVGLLVICILIVLYFIYLCFNRKICKLDIFKHILLFVTCLVVSICLTVCNKTVMFNDVNRLFHETSEVAKGNIDDSFGTFRFYIWKNTLKVMPNYFLHGVGVDCFEFAFGDYPLYLENSKSIIYFDKAHNEYLQKFVAEGVFSVVTYISLLLFIFVYSIRSILNGNKCINIGLLFGFVGYCIQAFFNISVIEVAPLFWIVTGLLYDR